MDDSDDLYDDSLVLDEETLSLLDKVEAQYAESNGLVTRQPTQSMPQPPPEKRQKIASQILVSKEYSFPEVLAIDAGGYTLPGVVLYDDVSRLANEDNANNNHGESSSSTNAARASQTSFRSQQLALGDDVYSLRLEIDKLSREREAAEKALKEARQARYTKEGEVSILRKQLEKAAQDHATDIEKLQATREAAEMKQAQLQKEMKEELDRMRTEFTFKQLELESSARRIPMTARAARIKINATQSPIPVPAAIRDWNSSANQDDNQNRETLAGQAVQQDARGKANAVNIPRFPGFENSFAPVSPTKSQLRQRLQTQKTPRRTGSRSNANTFSPSKGATLKSIQFDAPKSREVPIVDNIQDFDMDMALDNLPEAVIPRSSPIPDFADASSVLDGESVGELELEQHIELRKSLGLDWRNEFLSLLFMHKYSSQTFTTQLLLSAQFGGPLTTGEMIDAYQKACSHFLEALGSRYNTLEKMLPAVAESMIDIIGSLIKLDLENEHLVAFLDLVKTACISFPALSLYLLTSNDGDRDLLAFLLELLQSDLREKRSILVSVWTAVLSLLEALSSTTTSEHSERLSPMVLRHGLFLHLLGRSQKPKYIYHAVRLLCSLASHHPLYKYIVSHKGPTSQSESQEENSLLECLSVYLVDSDPLSTKDAHEILPSIIEFFSVLALANGEAPLVLVRSPSLIPAIVYYLFRLTSPIWEDDPKMMNDPDHARQTIKMIVATTQLVHYLIFDNTGSKTNVNCDLRHKLYYAPHRLFSGLAHMFVVMIGRLSYADPPNWLPLDLQNALETTTELARDLLDLVVEGPEGDAIWMAYQGAESKSSVTEDDVEDVEMS